MASARPRMLEILVSDTRQALKRLAGDWRFTLAAVLILAFGIGANTAVFSVVNSALFRKQAVEDPERVVNIYQNVGDDRAPLGTSFPAYLDIAEYGDVFAVVAATTFLPVPADYQDRERIRPALVEYATSSYLDVLGLRPAAGRWIRPEADAPDAEAEAVIGYSAWLTRFESDPGIIGRVIRIDGWPVTIVGIGPKDLASSVYSGTVTDFWLSTSAAPAIGFGPPDLLSDRETIFFVTRARLADGVALTEARAAMDNLSARLEVDHSDEDPGRGITVLSFEDVRIHPQLDLMLLPGAAVLLVVVGLVLVIACSNLSTLLLVRGASRSKEIGVRLALGASRRRIVGHLLTENLALAVTGGAAGFVLAHWTLRLVELLDLPVIVDFSLDYRVFGFTLGLSLATGMAFGMIPALKSTRVDVVTTLRDEGQTLSSERRGSAARSVLLTVQVAVSVVLLAGTALMFRSLVAAAGQDMGFVRDGVAILETDARYAGYDETRSRAVYDELLQRIRAIPGVEAATLTLGAPIEDFLDFRSLVIDGYEPAEGEASVPVQWMMAGPGYFETLEIPVLYGRDLEESDRADSPTVVIVNETMARRYFGTPNAVGHRFRYEGATDPVEIVGVAADTLQELIDSEPLEPRFYRQYTQTDIPATTVIARASVDEATLLSAMQRELRAIDPTLPVIRAQTMVAHLDRALAGLRILMRCLGGLALLGMSLASLGLYAVVSYAVTNRYREIGIRMALGALPGQVIRVVARDVSVLVGIGIGCGIALSVGSIFVLGRLAAVASESVGNIVQPSAQHPGTFVVVAVVMLVVGLLAAYLPARKATAVDPLEALRHS